MKIDTSLEREPELASRAWWRDKDHPNWPLAAMAVLLAAQFTLVFTRAINWDEFFYFHEVADFAEGRLDRPLQTLHTRLFFWLPGLYETSVDHIVVARLFMFGFELVTLLSIYFVAQSIAEKRVAIFAPLLYLSAGFVFQHGTSFRVDPIITACLMAGLAVLSKSRLEGRHIVLFGALIAVAGMTSIKAVLFAPAIAGLAIMRWALAGWTRRTLFSLCLCALSSLSLFALLYLWHGSDVTHADGATETSVRLLDSSRRWIFFVGIPPYWMMAVKSFFVSLFLYAALIATPFMTMRHDKSLPQKIGILGLWLPILTILFYTNTAAYFYVFILAPVAAACVLPLQWAVQRYSSLFLAAVLLANGVAMMPQEDRSIIDRQRQLERNIHEVFPQPVTYFDQNYMLGSWPKANGFMTSWGLAGYRSNGRPMFREAMERKVVPLFIANRNTLAGAITGTSDEVLLPEDNAAIRENYIEFSSYIWVAGKQISAKTRDARLEFLIPGRFTVGGGTLEIDGETYRPGEIVEIDRGHHIVTVPGNDDVQVIWGENLKPPTHPLDAGPLYVSF